ncbi:hypothetical protein P700755_002056 [Psychroflexus torquis ATCC 700755]|uniref:Uncharacterized protein n=1 Tax=Psychroflexus torquis (strain ATCC 700755 / CIP 106069 / ACAM 623) TaxID=313595 RepID=K4IEK5_PSYTT|nr:hypothetical protein [Psychroflexus torquis]AFU68849.1 hypothetical protein P700755_002056 [Psychroflexus torquis ATCC 700755]
MKFSSLSLLYFFILSANAQDVFLEKYQDYFELPRESIFVHTNKSVFTAGEHLWYKGYAIDRTNGKLSDNVRNIQVFVYDSIGNLIDKSMVLANKGIFFNQIKIDTTFTPGRYYFKAMTNYMNNFKESDAYFQKFEVIDEVVRSKRKAQDIEVVIRPEGQEIVYGLNSNLGIKITNDIGNPEESTLILFENNIPIKKITTSKLGLARMNFRPFKNKTYKIEVITIGGFKKIIPIGDIKSKGTSLDLINLKKHIYLNIETTSIEEHEKWQLFIFKDQNSISFNIEMNNSEKSIAIEKDKLFVGLNTIQLLKDGKAVLERMYLNEAIDETEFKVGYKLKQVDKQDSIILSLNFKNNSKLMLSASILPKENITYRSQQSIIKTLRLNPYIDNNDFKSFFDYTTLSNLNELDVLLLMSKSLHTTNLELSEPPALQYKRENGFDQILYLIDKIKKDDDLIVGIASRFNKDYSLKLDSSRVFFLKNKYPVIGEKLEYTAVNKLGNFKAPKLTLKTRVIFNNQHPILFEELDTLTFLKDISLSKNRVAANFTKTNELKEVIIKAPKNKEEKIDRLIRGTKEEITEDIVNEYLKLSDYLRAKGFKVREDYKTFIVQNLRNQTGGAGSVAFIVDGARFKDTRDMNFTSFLANARLDQFESITINKVGFGQGPFGSGGVIKLDSRKTPLYDKDNGGVFTSIDVTEGYNEIKKYTNPNYTSYNSETFKRLGSIAWFPNIVVQGGTQNNNSVDLKVVDTKLKEGIIYIEGISEDGQLHSYRIPIKLNNN